MSTATLDVGVEYHHDADYDDITHFYAWQMQLLDEGHAEAWADTFTEDGVFAANIRPEAAEGRAAIAAGARAAVDDLARRGVQTRHWLGLPVVTARGEDHVDVRSYALVFETEEGGQAQLHLSTVCHDELVRRDGRFLVRRRMVTRDDLPKGYQAS